MLMATIIQGLQEAALANKIMKATVQDSGEMFGEIVEHMTSDHPLRESASKDDAHKAELKSLVIKVIDGLFENAEFPPENLEGLRAQWNARLNETPLESFMELSDDLEKILSELYDEDLY